MIICIAHLWSQHGQKFNLQQTDSNHLLFKFKYCRNILDHVNNLAVLVVVHLAKMNESPSVQEVATEVSG